MEYMCLVYSDAKKRDTLSESEILAFREALAKSDHEIASGELQPVQSVVTVRVWNGRISLTDGLFDSAKVALNEFYFITARDLNDAIRVVSKMPQAQIGCIEVWPLKEGCQRSV